MSEPACSQSPSRFFPAWPLRAARGGSGGQAWPSLAQRCKALGAWGEELAAEHLASQGWQVLERNWRPEPAANRHSPLRGELDIIALDPAGTLVVVEVKTRSSQRYGPPAAAVGATKLRQLRLLAVAWARSHDTSAYGPLRLDVVSVLAAKDGSVTVRHHRGVGA